MDIRSGNFHYEGTDHNYLNYQSPSKASPSKGIDPTLRESPQGIHV